MKNMPIDYQKELVVGVEDEFLSGLFATGVAKENGFTSTHAVGAIAIADGPPAHGRQIWTFTAAADEYMSHLTTFEIFQFLQGSPIRFKVILEPELAVAVVQELNIFAGCMEDMDTASEFVAAGGGMRVGGAATGDSKFGFFCVEAGGAVFNQYWHAISGFNDQEQITELSAANVANLSGQDWKIDDGTDGFRRELVAEWVPTNLVPGVAGAAPTLMDAEVRFWINGILVAKHVMNGVNRITLAQAAATGQMNFGIVAENITDVVLLNVDYVKCDQLRQPLT